MDIDQARQVILRWIQDFVEVENPVLNGWATFPHARLARTNDLIEIRAGGADPYVDLRAVTDLSARNVIILVYDAGMFSAEEFNDLVNSANPAFMAGRGLIALAEHPASQEKVRSVIMNHDQYAMVLVQDLARLDRSARHLAEKGLYHDWPEPYLQDLFKGHRDPRA